MHFANCKSMPDHSATLIDLAASYGFVRKTNRLNRLNFIQVFKLSNIRYGLCILNARSTETRQFFNYILAIGCEETARIFLLREIRGCKYLRCGCKDLQFNEKRVYFPGCRNRHFRAEKGSSPQCRCWCCWYYDWSIYPPQTVSHLRTFSARARATNAPLCANMCPASSIMREQWGNGK